MKFLKSMIIIQVFIMISTTGCILNAKDILLTYLMRKHNAEYWFNNEKEKSFCHAIEWSDTKKMEALLKEGLNINTQGNMGVTFIIYSYLKSNKKSYEFLLEHGADPNIIMETEEKLEGRTPMEFKLSALSLAAEDASDPFYLKSCLNYGGNPNTVIDGRYVIYDALSSDNIINIQIIIEAGADINGLRKKSGEEYPTPISESISHNRYDIAYYLLQKGADPEITRDHIIWHMNEYELGTIDKLKVQREYKAKVKKILENRGFDFSLEYMKKINEERSNKEKERLKEFKKKHQNDNSKD